MNTFIKYLDSNEYISVERVSIGEHKKSAIDIALHHGQELPVSNAGFKVYTSHTDDTDETDYVEISDYSDYTFLYKQDEQTVVYTNDDTVFGRYYISNNDNKFVDIILSTTENYLNIYDYTYYTCTISSSMADVCDMLQESVVDDDGYYKYMIFDDQVIPATEKVKPEDIYGYPDKYAGYNEIEILEYALTEAYDVIDQQSQDIENLTNALIELYEEIHREEA